MSIGFGSLMNCISCSWVYLKTYWTGRPNTWKRDSLRINLTIDLHWCHDIPVTSTSPNHSIHWKAAPGNVKRSVAWSEHWPWIPLQLLPAPRMLGKLQRKHPPMKWQLKQYGHYVNSPYLLANIITWIYPWKYWTIHRRDLTRRKEFFENGKCRSLWRSRWIGCWKWNRIRYANKRFIRFVLQWRPLCMGRKSFHQQNGGSFRWALIDPSKQQPLGSMLLLRRQ